MYREDRIPSRGGGVLIAVKNSLVCTQIECIYDLEIVWVRVEIEF